MNEASYPALLRSADEASNRKQRLYLRLIGTEYLLLFVAAIFSMNVFDGTTFYLIYAFVFILSLAMLLTRALSKPEQDWYKCRALTESVKTLSWRYMMRAAPFDDDENIKTPRSEFRRLLQQTFEANKSTAEKIVSDWSTQDQITGDMDRSRSLDLEARKRFYLSDRIGEQRNWYASKAKSNKRSATNWVTIGALAYAIATALALSRIKFPDWHLWPIEPVIVFASSVIGWMQIKKFNELAASYVVAAHEIGFIEPKIKDVNSEPELSEAVNEAELAFSREHTLWIARQSN